LVVVVDSGSIAADGTGGGLAYFLSVQISMAIAQVINFFAQRNVTFKSNSSVGKAAFWYILAYIIITLAAGALQGLYKAPIYTLLMNLLGGVGETAADFITMIINSAISFWVFFPIFKVIFKNKPVTENKT
jgi:putative flippase GtrA